VNELEVRGKQARIKAWTLAEAALAGSLRKQSTRDPIRAG
jgi:hypothetical protein